MQIIFDTTVDNEEKASELVAFLINLYSLTPQPVTAANYPAADTEPKVLGSLDAQQSGAAIPPAQAAPALPVVPPAATGPERDSQGVPWDERIHSGGRSKNKDGAWNRKRGVGDVEYATVLTEIMGAQKPAPALPVVPATPALPVVPPTPDPVTSAATILPTVPPVPAAAPSLTWQQVCAVLTEKIVGGRVTPEQLNEYSRQFGVEPFALIGQKPELYQGAFDWLSSK